MGGGFSNDPHPPDPRRGMGFERFFSLSACRPCLNLEVLLKIGSPLEVQMILNFKSQSVRRRVLLVQV